MLTFLGYIIQLIIKPQRGWEDVATGNPVPHKLLRAGLYPMIVITALTSFVRVFYFTDYTWIDALQNAIINAVTYFATFFIASFVLSLSLEKFRLPDSGSPTPDDSDRVAIFSAAIVGILLLITLVSNLIPLDVSLLQYLPLYSAYVIWKGAPYLGIATEKTGHFVLIAVASLILPVYVLGYFFHLFT